MNKQILILGKAGSGKTTHARELKSHKGFKSSVVIDEVPTVQRLTEISQDKTKYCKAIICSQLSLDDIPEQLQKKFIIIQK